MYSVLAIGVKTAMLIQTEKCITPPYHQSVMEGLLNSARGPVAKMNDNVAQMTARCDLGRRTIQTMRGRNVQDRQVKG